MPGSEIPSKREAHFKAFFEKWRGKSIAEKENAYIATALLLDKHMDKVEDISQLLDIHEEDFNTWEKYQKRTMGAILFGKLSLDYYLEQLANKEGSEARLIEESSKILGWFYKDLSMWKIPLAQSQITALLGLTESWLAQHSGTNPKQALQLCLDLYLTIKIIQKKVQKDYSSFAGYVDTDALLGKIKHTAEALSHAIKQGQDSQGQMQESLHEGTGNLVVESSREENSVLQEHNIPPLNAEINASVASPQIQSQPEIISEEEVSEAPKPLVEHVNEHILRMLQPSEISISERVHNVISELNILKTQFAALMEARRIAEEAQTQVKTLTNSIADAQRFQESLKANKQYFSELKHENPNGYKALISTEAAKDLISNVNNLENSNYQFPVRVTGRLLSYVSSYLVSEERLQTARQYLPDSWESVCTKAALDCAPSAITQLQDKLAAANRNLSDKQRALALLSKSLADYLGDEASEQQQSRLAETIVHATAEEFTAIQQDIDGKMKLLEEYHQLYEHVQRLHDQLAAIDRYGQEVDEIIRINDGLLNRLLNWLAQFSSFFKTERVQKVENAFIAKQELEEMKVAFNQAVDGAISHFREQENHSAVRAIIADAKIEPSADEIEFPSFEKIIEPARAPSKFSTVKTLFSAAASERSSQSIENDLTGEEQRSLRN
ncbi:hypothetical protein [Legionella jordanis]|uniref:Purine NTPase n=1 Tax=Legionella jordanis TaxID=456 RepID=A0A0W0VDW8_9GAMM|nr:hypothetical protein [Legionella jordanis]KTD18348.1 purine NTPase [Legionella jordanis]RMX05259.1 hypothetical protein EAW55_00940 [Legionella jordanis]RMX20890.1 hypothetical protein EAS68_06105 [Legionella jordanis]VEH13306.1 purine NTPase, putative [Legionella jordanis]HAT8713654.1 hypothetical protein [Legionella jordanis]